MNDPKPMSEAIGRFEVVRIPKHCPTCNKDFEGNAFAPLRSGEVRRVYPCDDCITKAEEAVKAQQEQLKPKVEAVELRRPQRTGDADERYP